jgi:elongation factor P
MSVRATELRKGTVIEKDGSLLLITDYHHHTPGNLRAIIHIKTKDLRSGKTDAMRLSSNDTLEVAYLDKRASEYLYKEGEDRFVFMDSNTYEQFTLSAELVGDQMGFVRENSTVDVTFHDGVPIGVDLPTTVVLKVAESEPAVKGNTATNVKKDAILETGLQVKVPLHISVGEEIKIRTQDGEFQGRSN